VKVCISTVCSADEFSWYLPGMLYTINRSYPECFTKIFLKGKLNPDIKKVLDEFKVTNYEILEKQFSDVPDRTSTCNTLRHLVSGKHYEGFDYVFICDADFLFFRQDPPFYEYFANRIKKCKQPYAGFRGPRKMFYRPEISPDGWMGHFTRIADGTLMLKNPDWFKATRKARRKYLEIVRKGTHDKFDKHPACIYREYNEVMLYRICRMSRLKTPAKSRHFVDGKKFNFSYRQFHLGDFKFNGRFNVLKKMRRLLTESTARQFYELQNEPEWQRLCKAVSEKSSLVKKAMRKADKWAKIVLREDVSHNSPGKELLGVHTQLPD